MQLQATAGGLNLVIGFGAAALVPPVTDTVLTRLAPFQPVEGVGGRGVPSAERDVWLWLHGTGPDVVLDGARLATATLAPVAHLVRGASFRLPRRPRT